MSGGVFDVARQKVAAAMAGRVLVRKTAKRGHGVFTLAGEARCVRQRLVRQHGWSCRRCTGNYFGSMLYVLIDPDCPNHGALLQTAERHTP